MYMDGGPHHPMLDGARLEKLAGMMRRGVGLVCLHYSVEAPKELGGPATRVDGRIL